MKLFRILIPCALLLLNACGPKELMKISFGRVESFRTESLRFGSVEGTAIVSLYNGNEKSVTFGSGRFDVRLGKRTLGVITLLQPVRVLPGYSRTEMPVRIRFSQDGSRAVSELVLPGRESRGRKPHLRVSGSLGIDRGGRMQNVRFNRKIGGKALESLGGYFVNPVEFKLLR